MFHLEKLDPDSVIVTVNFVVWRSTLNVTGQNEQKLAKFENFIYFDLI
jgi:hypothetical protein